MSGALRVKVGLSMGVLCSIFYARVRDLLAFCVASRTFAGRVGIGFGVGGDGVLGWGGGTLCASGVHCYLPYSLLSIN